MKFFVSLLKRSFENKLLAGSFIMMVGSLATGFGNYLYHLLMGRMLGPVHYGILASLISLLYLLSIPVGTLNLVTVKFVSTLKGQKKSEEINALFKWVNQRIFIFGLAMLLIFLVLSPFLVSFLHLDSILPLIIIGFFALVTVMTMINRATLQGLLRFSYLSASSVLEVALKLVFAVLLVTWGLRVSGALLACIIGGVAGYFFSFFPLRYLLKAETKKRTLNSKEMIVFAIPVFLLSLSFTSLYTTDIILVRHFLLAQDAGYYAALATLGKIIYFFILPITLVMFPMISERHANGGHYRPLLLISFGLVGLICFGITLVYFLLPGLMVTVLFGRAYLAAASHLGLFAIFLSFYSLAFLLANFYLSINKTKVVIFPLTAAALQTVLIFFFHQGIRQVIWISVGVSALLLFSLLLYSFDTIRETISKSQLARIK